VRLQIPPLLLRSLPVSVWVIHSVRSLLAGAIPRILVWIPRLLLVGGNSCLFGCPTHEYLGCPIHAVSSHEWAFARRREPLSPVVNLTAMPNPRHRNYQLLIVNRINHPIIPNANPSIPLPTLQLLATRRTRLRSQPFQLRNIFSINFAGSRSNSFRALTFSSTEYLPTQLATGDQATFDLVERGTLLMSPRFGHQHILNVLP
jgi:hypothetical protein